MNKLYILKSVAYGSAVTSHDLTELADGAIAIFEDGASEATDSALSGKRAMFAVGTAEGPQVFPEVDLSTLEVVKSTYAAETVWSQTFTFPTAVDGKEYGIIVCKKGVVANERNKWSFSIVANGTAAADAAAKLVADINNKSKYTGITASNSGAAVTVTTTNGNTDYSIVFVDGLEGTSMTSTTVGKKAVLDKAYVEELVKYCAADSGFRHPGMEAAKLYPGMFNIPNANSFVQYSLKFSTTRESAKPTDERVNQVVNIVVPSASASVDSLDTIFSL